MARVLVVEDEDLIREMMVLTLREAGFEVDEAANVDEADALIEADGYRLLVTDIHMPGRLNGLDLARKAHVSEPRLPILFVTGRPDVLNRLKTAGIPGATIPKPFTLARLTSIAR